MSNLTSLRVKSSIPAMFEALRQAAMAYSMPQAGAPIVDQHFTAGNQQRYGWAPLSAEYFAQKAAGIATKGGGGIHVGTKGVAAINALKRHLAGLRSAKFRGSEKGANKFAKMEFDKRSKAEVAALTEKMSKNTSSSRLDKNATFAVHDATTGVKSGVNSGTNLPMLVRTGLLRKSVTTGNKQIIITGDKVIILFQNLPGYAIYLHTGTDKMPKRSPVEPNAADRAAFAATAHKVLKQLLGRGRTL